MRGAWVICLALAASMLLNGVAGAEVGHERSAMQVAQKLVVDCHSQLQRADAHRRRLQLGTEFSIDSTTNSSDTLLNPNSYYALAQLQRSATLRYNTQLKLKTGEGVRYYFVDNINYLRIITGSPTFQYFTNYSCIAKATTDCSHFVKGLLYEETYWIVAETFGSSYTVTTSVKLPQQYFSKPVQGNCVSYTTSNKIGSSSARLSTFLMSNTSFQTQFRKGVNFDFFRDFSCFNATSCERVAPPMVQPHYLVVTNDNVLDGVVLSFSIVEPDTCAALGVQHAWSVALLAIVGAAYLLRIQTFVA